MDLAALRRLACPSCARPHDLFVLLDHARGALRSGPWARVACPSCGAEAHLELASGRAAIGRVHDQHGPRFDPAERVEQPGLVVRGRPDGIEIELLHRSWVLPRGR